MAITLEVVDSYPSRRKRKIKYKGTVADAPANYPDGGDTVDFTAATNPKFLPKAFLSKPVTKDQVTFLGSGPDGLIPEYVEGNALTNGKIKFYNSATDANEHAAGNYSAGEKADPFYFEVEVPIHN